MTNPTKLILMLFLIGSLLVSCAPLQAPATETPTPTANTPAIPTATQAASPTSPVETATRPSSPVIGTVEPTQNGGSMVKGSVVIESAGVTYDQNLKQAVLNLSGSLPTPCHQLSDTVSKPDGQNNIHVEVFSLVDPKINCTQVIKPFEASYPLGNLPPGQYTVYVNGSQVGQVQIP